MARGRKYPPELRERAVKTVLESGRPIAQVARDLDVHKESLRNWVRLAEADAGTRSDVLNTVERDRMRLLEREVKELRRQNEILKAASVFFAKELDGTPRR
ncbi:transposase [Paraconexibacter antarcticus]|uniref:Transposase n=1 Tax=Paraconexibacter antarcticus TaxID=2949664 RepID=A0ABY5DR25_9ACTN|nr:transposase [Paraconexibacter antarcticus]UTI62315.1 transposase [Paraconexibacter antarcticus]UTI62643.1 transposase [Paraconexibacter antarcticus]UTI63271.1 transposase [Paraconexibacter antarcticus]UTI63359.1 transposase [Paraconexibacter antarcticus]UTI63907.1 transposase [Paraconexibacter antarcticus]